MQPRTLSPAPMLSRLTLACGVALAAAPALGADAYTATVLPTLTGGTSNNAFAVNDAGVVVGQADDDQGVVVGYVYMNGAITPLPLLAGGEQALPQGINNANVIVGACKVNGIDRACKWTFDAGTSAWTVVELPTLRTDNAGLGVAQRINAGGQIVGYASSDAGGYHACLWPAAGGAPADLGTLGHTGALAYSQGLGINDAGDTCGYAYRVLAGPEHGWKLVVGGHGQEDISPTDRFGLAQWHAINAAGVMFGYISGQMTSGAFTPAYHTPGVGIQPTTLVVGTEGGYGYDLNDAGVGVGTNFLLAPAPDPNLFLAVKVENGVTTDLNTITTGLPGVMTEARDVSNTGLIVGTVDAGGFPLAVLLTPSTPPCRADYNGQNGVDLLDIFAFLQDWFDGVSTADFNGQGGVELLDIFAFLEAWFTGCP